MPNLNRFWADLIVEECVRSGADTFFLAPGSRSTPLTTAVAAHPQAHAVMHFDERGTAFAALGYGRATRRPAVWITTSGTAVANGLPAVVEAATDGVPMLLLTADRPPELRATGANQTIDQVKLFGDYVRWFFDLPAPDPALDPRAVLTTLDQALYQARRAPGGPVHLNAMFREPLAPEPDAHDLDALGARIADWRASEAPFTRYGSGHALPEDADLDALWTALRSVRRGLVVAGALHTAAEGQAAARLAEALGWPLLPDAGSQVRLGPAAPTAAPHFDLFLGSDAFRAAHAPEAVLHLGRRATSKRLLQWLGAVRPRPMAVVQPGPARFDPNHQVTHRLEGNVAATCEALAERAASGERSADADWLRAWQDASRTAGATVEAVLTEDGTLSEPRVARLLTEHLPEGHGLVLASSMPVRDVDMVAAPGFSAPFVAANRGASGIDGTIATAAGVAVGLEAPVTLLIGDLSLLHDLNSLALLRRLPQPVTVVVINNDGGGIFHFLPIARHTDVFEPYFGTPHGLTFEHAAAQFGLAYLRADGVDGFEAAYGAATNRSAATLIEVRTDRSANVALHRHLLEHVRTALDG